MSTTETHYIVSAQDVSITVMGYTGHHVAYFNLETSACELEIVATFSDVASPSMKGWIKPLLKSKRLNKCTIYGHLTEDNIGNVLGLQPGDEVDVNITGDPAISITMANVETIRVISDVYKVTRVEIVLTGGMVE